MATDRKYNIVIATGIYPPHHGGPATYAFELHKQFTADGHTVTVVTYETEHKLPTGIRHLWYFFRLLFKSKDAHFILALDTFSVGFPAALVHVLLRIPLILRTGGDFLWEGYVERTKEKVLLRNFYTTTWHDWNIKERIIFRLTRWTIHHVSRLVFSTQWQYDIWKHPYQLRASHIVKNHLGPYIGTDHVPARTFAGWGRPLVWKNTDTLIQVFDDIKKRHTDVLLDMTNRPWKESMEVLASSYAFILISLGDISPNLVHEALERGVPCIVTKECGLDLGDLVLWVNPRDETEIKGAIEQILDPKVYKEFKTRIAQRTDTHTWNEIADEYITIFETI